MNVRLAAPGDASQVIRLVSALLVELGGSALDPARARPVYEALLARPELGFVHLAEAGGAAGGVCTVSFAHARAAGCPFAELGTPLGGARQVDFYRRSGFAPVGERLRCMLGDAPPR
jgi:hypothetical protein